MFKVSKTTLGKISLVILLTLNNPEFEQFLFYRMIVQYPFPLPIKFINKLSNHPSGEKPVKNQKN